MNHCLQSLSLRRILVLMMLGLAGCADQPRGLDTPMASGDLGAMSARLVRMGDDAMQAGDAATAVGLYSRVARLQPDDVQAVGKLGDALLTVGQPQEAVEAYGVVLRRQPGDNRAATGYAKAMLMLGRPDAALAQAETAYAVHSDDLRLANLIGVSLDLMGRHAEAQEIYRAALSRAPAQHSLSNNLALSQLLAGEPQAAVQTLSPLVATGSDPRTRMNLAAAQVFAGDRSAAQRTLRGDVAAGEMQVRLARLDQLRSINGSIELARALLLEPVPIGSPVAVEAEMGSDASPGPSSAVRARNQGQDKGPIPLVSGNPSGAMSMLVTSPSRPGPLPRGRPSESEIAKTRPAAEHRAMAMVEPAAPASLTATAQPETGIDPSSTGRTDSAPLVPADIVGTAQASGNYVLSLAGPGTDPRAYWQTIKTAHRSSLTGVGLLTAMAGQPLTVGPFSDKATADQLCRALQESGQECTVALF